MNSCAYLSRSHVISSLLFILQPTSWTVIVSAQCPLSLDQGGCQAESFLLEGSEQSPAYLSGTVPLLNATSRKPATSNPPFTLPPSCCAPIKAELIKPQLIASAGGGRRRKTEGRGAYNYTLAFTYYFQHIALGWQSLPNAYVSLLTITLNHAAAVECMLKVRDACF